jgi:spoIIIJ-associated protein
MEWVESTGSSIEEAKERALDRLGVHGDDAEFEIVSDVKTGLFGRVKEDARVRARVAPATPRAKEEGRGRGRGRGAKGGGRGNQRGRNQGNDRNNRGSGAQKGGSRKGGSGGPGAEKGRSRNTPGEKGRGNGRNAEASNRGAKKSRQSETDNASSRGGKREKTMNDDEGTTMPLPQQADLAEEFVRGLAQRFGTQVEFSREDIDDEEIRITVSGDDLGRMIGRRGTTAGAIDELVRTVLQRQAGSSRNGRIRVDIGGVRARRAEALANFARAQAEEVRSSGSARSLEPMSAADRKVVHDALSDEDGVDTVSEGEDSQRRVVIVPSEGIDSEGTASEGTDSEGVASESVVAEAGD